MGMPAVAVTDHGNLFGLVHFADAAKTEGIKPIFGLETYVTPGNMEEASGTRNAGAYHVVLLAYNEKGYGNLIKLSSQAYLRGFYHKPRVDYPTLYAHTEGLICLSGCIQGQIACMLSQKDIEGATRLAETMREAFGRDNFFLEMQDNGMPSQRAILEPTADLGRRLGIPLVATNDVHYLSSDDADAHDILLCISTRKTINDESRLRFSSSEFYFKSSEEMREVFDRWPEAIENTGLIAARCNVKLDTSRKYPRFPLPDGADGLTFLRNECERGLKRRHKRISEEMQQRLDYELDVISGMGYVDYFLIVWDFVRFAREKHIPIGLRGSGGGAMVAYAIGMTDINPISHQLLFNRFLDPERQEAPDIDVDICERRREEVIAYVKQKYKEANCAQIITFGTMAARGALRDVGRALDVPLAEVNAICKLVPEELHISLQDSLDKVSELKERYEKSPEIRRLFDMAMKLEGLTRHSSVHAAGLVISDRPLCENVPLSRTGDGPVVTQYDMNSLEKTGMLKMDFLGLRQLTIVDLTCRLIEERGKGKIDIENLDLTDAKTYELITRGDTLGVFQLASAGMRQLLAKLKPSCIEDIIAVVALYRPGPLGSGMIDSFINRKHGREPITHLDDTLASVLENTYGIIVYQEQIMQIANQFAGMSMAKALSLIKAISKKKAAVIEEQHGNFVAGAVAKGIDPDKAESVFALIYEFASYGFNKAHTCAYAYLAYKTAYLKAHFPTEFMAVNLSCEISDTSKLAEFIEECKRHDIKVLPPSINESRSDFTIVDEGCIRFGLGAIKNLGEKTVEAVLQARDAGGAFKSIFDLTERVDSRCMNKSALEFLIKAGAMDCLAGHRAQFFEAIEDAMKVGAGRQRDRRVGQMGLFGAAEAEPKPGEGHGLPDVPPWPEMKQLQHEKEAIGLFVSKHPMDQLASLTRGLATPINALTALPEGTYLQVAGYITSTRRLSSSKGGSLQIITLEDSTGSLDVVVYNDRLDEGLELMKEDNIVFVGGELSLRRGVGLIAQWAMSPEDATKKLGGKVTLILDVAKTEELGFFKTLADLLRDHSGQAPVEIILHSPKHKLAGRLGAAFRVDVSNQLKDALEGLLGGGRVIVGRNGNGHAPRPRRNSGRQFKN